MIERKTRRRVKKAHKKAVETGLLGLTEGAGRTELTCGFYEDDTLKRKETMLPSTTIVDMLRALNDNDYLIVKALVKVDPVAPTKVLGFDIRGQDAEDYAIYYKFKRTSKPKGINKSLEPLKKD
jgi:hypothetical protein